MNESYLFRGKRSDNLRKNWVTGHYVSVPRHMIVLEELQQNGSWYCFDVDPSTIGRCTGLTVPKSSRGDNEKDAALYEGDMFVPYYVDPMGRLAPGKLDTENKGVITYKNGCFCLQRKNRNPVPLRDFLNYKPGDYMPNHGMLMVATSQELNGEIIGNIHDNPELLEAQ